GNRSAPPVGRRSSRRRWWRVALDDRLRLVHRLGPLRAHLARGQVPDGAGVVHGETGGAVAGAARLARRDRHFLRRRDVGALAGLRGHVELLGAPQRHRDRRRRPPGGDQDAAVGDVLELDVDDAAAVRVLEDGRFPPRRVAADVVAVRLVLDVFHPGEVGRVVQGGGELRDAAANGLPRASVLDDPGLHVALRRGARAGVAVQAERFARLDDRAVDLLGHAPDVLAGSGFETTGGELADDLLDAELVGLLGGELRRLRLVHRVEAAVLRPLEHVHRRLEGL